jgi:hypothetical protein
LTEEYHSKTNEFCRVTNIATSKMSAGLASLVTKGILTKEKKECLHSPLQTYSLFEESKFGIRLCD